MEQQPKPFNAGAFVAWASHEHQPLDDGAPSRFLDAFLGDYPDEPAVEAEHPGLLASGDIYTLAHQSGLWAFWV